ncbi:MAG: helix-turn-helix transcriptional regulator [Bacilli bacterium]|nr:helix-turn-helix transcriptional regulator [Bacilli bacterium]
MLDITKLDINYEFGKRIQYLRKKKGRSQEDFAFECGINKNYLSDVERGRRNPTLKILEKIANGLGITLEELFKGLGIK